MKILIMTDNPNLRTGMGRVGREISMGLHKRGHKMSYLGWFSSPDLENKMPFPIHRTLNNYYGSDVFDQVIMKERPDVVLTIGDIWMVKHIGNPNQCRTRRLFRWVGYVPIDGAAEGNVIPPTWKETFLNMDVKVAYTEYGKRIITNSLPELKEEIKLIPHGVDIKTFNPLPQKEVNNLRRTIGLDVLKPNGEVKRKVCFLIVARNQFRKNIPEIVKVWKKFKLNGKHQDAVIFPHMNFQDQMGWNLDEIFDINDIRQSLMFFDKIAHAGSNISLMPEQDLNKLYNVCDVFLLLSGEGFGLPIVEAMACAKPVIVLDHSACSELAHGRGETVRVAYTITGKYSTERPYPDEKELLEAMDRLYRNEVLRAEYGLNSYKFVAEGDPNLYHGKALTWENACDQWEEVIQSIAHPLAKPIKLREVA